MSAWGMLKQGKVGDALVRVIETIFGFKLPPELADFVHKFTTDEGQILWDAGKLAVADIKAGKALQTTAEEVWAQISDKVPSMALKDLQDAIGIQARAETPAA